MKEAQIKSEQLEEILNVLLEIQKEITYSHFLNQEVFSLQQFCKYAGLSQDQGYKLTSDRKIRFYRPGGKKIYIDRQDAIAYLKQNPVSTQTSTENLVNNFILKHNNT